MAMSHAETERFGWLKAGGCVPMDYVTAYYGLTWSPTDEFSKAFETYRGKLLRRADCRAGWVSRYELERFMAREEISPKKWMAARLGMAEGSFDGLLSKLDEFGMIVSRYDIYSKFVADSLPEDLVRHLPGLNFRIFANHSNFCMRLHAELEKVKLKVEPLFCATSKEVGESPCLYARHFDCLTAKPLSTKHSVWLDFHKPISLPPDRCSKLFYARNRDDLKSFSAGTTEPDGLDIYEPFLTGGHDA